MKVSVSAILVTAFSLALLAPDSEAQLTRSAVSVNGSDANPCTTILPCRALDRAISQTNADGEVIILDSGGFGPFTVDKSLTVAAAPGAHAAISSAPGGDGITVNAPSDGRVAIRGLQLHGRARDGQRGIVVLSAAAVFVESCVIRQFQIAAIAMLTPGKLYVSDSIIRENTGNYGILINASGAKAVIERSRLDDNSSGLVVDQGEATARDTSASGNFNDGFRANAQTANDAVLVLENCLAAYNTRGITLGGGSGAGKSIVTISNVTATGNATGLQSFGGPAGSGIFTFGNNRITGNATNGTPTGAVVPQM